MAVAEIATLNDQSSRSSEFTPSGDFFIAVDKGQVSLEAKLPGMDKFYLVSSAGIEKISALSQGQSTIVKVSTYMTGTKYKLVPQSRKATAKAYEEA